MDESGEDGRAGWVLRDYSMGVMSRSTAMQRLGFVCYGQLVDAMAAAGLRMQVPAEAAERMDASLRRLFGDGCS